MGIYHSVEQLVGNTPLLSVDHYVRARRLEAVILAKLERCNPAGSAKDRVALEMLRQAEASGVLQPGGTVIEPTSGNTGIGLAAMAIAKGYRVILTMPATMSAERRALLKAYGAELVLVAEGGMAGAVSKAEELAREIPGSFIPGQFDNPANPAAHYKTTGPEIWRDTEGHVDIFVAGVGTGGTISGTGRYLKEQNPHVRIVAVEPASSPLLSQGHAGPHGLQGIGANFVPGNYDAKVVDEILTVTDEDAYRTGRLLARTEGIMAGITSGAALWAADELARRPENRGKTIVALLPDDGGRYLSTPLWSEE
ncbi:MAG: cysteine synthase A [Vescimonas sp.]